MPLIAFRLLSGRFEGLWKASGVRCLLSDKCVACGENAFLTIKNARLLFFQLDHPSW